MAPPDYMMLTLSSPARHTFDYKPTHEFAVQRTSAIPSSLSTPPPERGATSSYLSSSVALPSTQQPASSAMTAPHRGLPPPAPLTLPDPSRLPAPIPGQSHSSLPAPPPQWHGMEDPMKNWLATKLEEEKRKQEEEKTQQESLRLEQKKIEQNMLQEVIRSGYPPTMVPMLFMALGGTLAGVGNTTAGIDLLQQYLAQFTSQQQQTHPSSPEAARERAIPQSQPGAYASAQSVPPTPLSGPYGGFSGGRGGTGSGPPSSQRTHFSNVLPRISTVEGGPTNAGQQSTPQQEQQTSILFHHWQPPSSQAEGSGGTQQTNVTPSDYASSPKKRKAPASHHSNPPPSSTLRFSETSHSPRRVTTGHSRQRSDLSARGAPMSQPEERPTFSRPRADTLTTEHSSTGSELQWQHHRYGSQQPPQLRGQPPEAHSESPSHGSFEGRSRRSSQAMNPGSADRTPIAEGRPTSRDDVEMIER